MSCRESPFRLKPACGPFCEVTQRVEAKVPDGVRRPEYLRPVPNISGNAALDVLIGLFFLYFLLSLVCSAINESNGGYLSAGRVRPGNCVSSR